MAPKTKKRGPDKVPFHPQTGAQLHYPDPHIWKVDPDTGYTVMNNGRAVNLPVDWRENFEFEAVMCLDDFSRGRSAAYFHLTENETGTKYTMFMTDLMRVIAEVGIGAKGVIPRSRWTFAKRGQNYGVRLAD